MTKLDPKAQFTAADLAKHERREEAYKAVRAERRARYRVREPRRTESSLQGSIMYAARRLGFLAVKLRGHGRRGMPDLLLISPEGVVGFLEVKIPGGKLSALQERFINTLHQHGQRVATVWKLEEAIAFLQDMLDVED